MGKEEYVFFLFQNKTNPKPTVSAKIRHSVTAVKRKSRANPAGLSRLPLFYGFHSINGFTFAPDHTTPDPSAKPPFHCLGGCRFAATRQPANHAPPDAACLTRVRLQAVTRRTGDPTPLSAFPPAGCSSAANATASPTARRLTVEPPALSLGESITADVLPTHGRRHNISDYGFQERVLLTNTKSEQKIFRSVKFCVLLYQGWCCTGFVT